jgi:Sec-independent protein translocase protein TatA
MSTEPPAPQKAPAKGQSAIGTILVIVAIVLGIRACDKAEHALHESARGFKEAALQGERASEELERERPKVERGVREVEEASHEAQEALRRER